MTERLLPTLPETVRGEFLASVRSFIGTPYLHQGRSTLGMDCVGVPILALSQIGLQCDDLFGYSSQPDGTTLRENVEKHLGPAVARWKPGDIVLMRWHENRRGRVVYANHVGVLGVAPYGNRWTLIHSFKAEQRVTECSLAGQWARRVLAVFSLTGA